MSHAYEKRLARWLESEGEHDDESAPPELDRRAMLALLGASMGLAGVTGCERQRTEKILPYTVTPPEMKPGIPQTYTTSMELDGFATGLLVKVHDGRPSKIEGNPEHPASLGAAGPYEQASVLSLYDPDRARAARKGGSPASFEEIVARFGADRGDAGARLRFMLEPTGSPLVGELAWRIQQRFPEVRFTFHSPLRTTYASDGGQVAFGIPIQPQYDFSKASVILAIDADFLSGMPFSMRYARQFAAQRRTSAPDQEMSRLYVVETMISPTGAIADHRFARKPGDVGAFLGAVAAELAALVPGRLPRALASALAALRSERDAAAGAVARDLAKGGRSSVVVVGENQPASVHAIGYLIDVVILGSEAFGCIAPTLVGDGLATQPLPELVAEISDRRVDTLAMLGGNPVYTTEADLDFERGLELVGDSLYLGAYENETAERAAWFVPAAHYLESWGDARAYDGTLSIQQPLIDPLFAGRSIPELLAIFAGDRTPRGHDLVRAAWSRGRTQAAFDTFWQETLVRGVVAGSASPPLAPSPRLGGLVEAVRDLARMASRARSMEIAFLADPGLYDGRFANNGWLQEFPKPLTKLTWDNAALVSVATASRLGVETEDVVRLERLGRSITVPALVVPGHADEAVSIYLGHGRKGSESLARDVGANAFVLRTSDARSFGGSLAVGKVKGARRRLAMTQQRLSTEGRPVALSVTLGEWRAHPDFTEPLRAPLPSLFHPKRLATDQWAMTIDTSICTGCGSCVLGCQSENNVFIVGRENVLRRREMHWLRIDTYYGGSKENPEVLHEPMLCQHCEKAPCEYVCPVNATVHSPDGLNEMVYNRCVGTRFCSNNCPYKVRRFNWFDWVERQPANQGLVRLQRNPNVTVRERGVMEKCTYCVQRIRGAEILARGQQRDIRPGEVVTACQQACPTGAIQFDSLAHTETKMVAWRKESRAFSVLHELNTSPRTQYLARVRNPNPEIVS
jgi:molybdopterin-containing oxidoreductase family iron-sulfur binding subunit